MIALHGQTVTCTDLAVPGSLGTTISGVTGRSVFGTYEAADTNFYGFTYSLDSQTFTTIDPSAATSTGVTGISGSLVTGSFTNSLGVQHGFIYNTDTQAYTTFDPPGSVSTDPEAISGNNVVGSYSDGSTTHGFLYDTATHTYTTLDVAGTSANDAKAISGNNVAIQSDNSAYLYNIQTRLYTGIPFGTFTSQASAISPNFLAGNFHAPSVFTHGYLYDLGTAAQTTIDPFSSTGVFMAGVSGNYATGYYSVTTGTRQSLRLTNHGFFYQIDTGATIEFDPPSSVQTFPVGMDGNVIVGNYEDGASGDSVAFVGIYTNTASVTLNGNFNPIYDGTPKALTAATDPGGLTVAITYQALDSNDNPIGLSTTAPPVNAGTYVVTGVINDTYYSGSSSDTIVIHPQPVTITVENLIGNSAPTYNGSPYSLSASSSPPGVAFTLHYSGNSNTHGIYPNPQFGETDGAPTNAGTYFGTPVIDDPNYTLASSNTGELVIQSAPQVIDLSSLGPVTVNDVIVLPSRTSAGIGIVYFLIDPTNGFTTATDYATLTEGDDGVTDNVLTILKQGPITLYASAPGDNNHLPSDTPTQSLSVNLDTAGIVFNALSFPADGSVHPVTVTTTPANLFTDGDVAFTYVDSQGNTLNSAPVAAGKYTVTATITDPNDVWQGTATGTMYIGQGFSSWQALNFTSTDPAVIGPAATPQHDATPNLLKYLCDIDPSRTMTNADRAALPKVEVTPDNTMMKLTYRRNGAMAGVVVAVQTSFDLTTGSWATPSNITTTETTDADPMVTILIPIATSVAHPSQYLRLNLTIP